MPVYIDERSNPASDQYFWAYRVLIVNEGNETVQVISRYWHITDARGQVQEVRGMGVVGEQPVLNGGDCHEYTSGCPLITPSGFMRGHYVVKTMSGEEFNVEIPAFPLDLPDSRPTVN